MTTLDLTKQYAHAVWKKSDQTTKLVFSDSSDRVGTNSYCKTTHTIFLCPSTLVNEFTLLADSGLSYEEYVSYATAHELGHSVDSNNDFNNATIELMEAVAQDDAEKISLCKNLLFTTKFQQEVVAWKNSRRFVDISNKNTFYFLVRSCLSSYIENKDKNFNFYFQIFVAFKHNPDAQELFKSIAR